MVEVALSHRIIVSRFFSRHGVAIVANTGDNEDPMVV